MKVLNSNIRIYDNERNARIAFAHLKKNDTFKRVNLFKKATTRKNAKVKYHYAIFTL